MRSCIGHGEMNSHIPNRVDFAYTIHTGQAPLFGHEHYLFDAQTSVITQDADGDEINSNLYLPRNLKILVGDHRVVSLFSDLRRLSCRLNHERRLQDSDFKLAICSIQYRLLSLENSVNGSMAECLRLAMLVFLTTTFEIPERAGQRYPYLSDRFRESCCGISAEGPKSEAWNDFMMWLLIIGGVSLFGVDEVWLRELWEKVFPSNETWQTVRDRVKKFLWIDVLHDKLGKEMFNIFRGDGVDDLTAKKSKSSAWWLSGWGICPLEL